MVKNSFKKMENSLVELIQEIGYSFTTSQEECRNGLLSICTAENVVEALSATTVARVLSMMIRTQSAAPVSESTADAAWLDVAPTTAGSNKDNANAWNLDVFVLCVQELSAALNWKDVVREFDHPEFFVRDKYSLKQLVQALKKVLKDTFPIEHIYRVWKNPEGQVGLF
jgi:hypothetical protein